VLVTRVKRVKKKRCETPRGLCHVGCARMAGHHSNKDGYCVLGEIARGLFYFSPGFSPLCRGVLLSTARHNRSVLLAQRIYRRELIMELPTQRTSKVQSQIYSWWNTYKHVDGRNIIHFNIHSWVPIIFPGCIHSSVSSWIHCYLKLLSLHLTKHLHCFKDL